MAEKVYPEEIECPQCRATLLLDHAERLSGELTCPECGRDIRLNGTRYAEPIDIDINANGLADEIKRGIHASKSYVGLAFLTLFLYYAGFYIIGLICNLVFISQANESRRVAGSSPSGRGCLMFLVWVHLVIPAIVLFIIFLFTVLAGIFAPETY